MTKDEFKKRVLELLEDCVSLQDDIWDSCYPTMSSVFIEADGNRIIVTIGVDEAGPEQPEGR